MHGLKKWKDISKNFYDKTNTLRTPKQCRDRWFNALKIKERIKIGKKESMDILSCFEIYGPQWSKLSNLLTNFTENELKNFINATVRRNVRRFNKNRSMNERINECNIRLLNIPQLRQVLLVCKSQEQSWFDDFSVSQEVFLMIKKQRYENQDLILEPIPDSTVDFSPVFSQFEETDLPCEDLFS